MYYIYHIAGIKIGCTNNLQRRIREQNFNDYELLEEHNDKFVAANRERELQIQYGYRLDNIPYTESLKRITKAQEISLKTKDKWLPNVDWKAREQNINQKEKWDKVKSHPNYINRKISNGSEQLKKVILQYDLYGNFIKEWDCGARNMHKYGFAYAGGTAKENTGTLHGYQWRYKTSEDYPKFIGQFINKIYQKVIQKDLKGNIIKIWDSQQQAANELECSVQLISRVCKGIGKTAKGFIWERYV